MSVLNYRTSVTGQWIPIVSGPKGPKGDKGDPGGVAGPPGTPGATTHSALTDLALLNDEHPQYLKAAGDTVEGQLKVNNDPAEITWLISGVEKFAIKSLLNGSLVIERYISPGVRQELIRIDNATGNTLFVGGHSVTNDSTFIANAAATFNSTATFANGANMNDKKITNVLTPTAADDAANKAYVDGVGGIMGLSDNVVTGTGNHWLNGQGSPLLWGGVGSGSDYLSCPKAGWYRCSFNGTFETNNTGTVRQMRLATGDAGGTGIPAAANHIGTSVYPNSWSGWGLNTTASGIWHLNPGTVIRVMARHDATSTLSITATMSMQLVKAD